MAPHSMGSPRECLCRGPRYKTHREVSLLPCSGSRRSALCASPFGAMKVALRPSWLTLDAFMTASTGPARVPSTSCSLLSTTAPAPSPRT